jgi:hypothetical protein
MPLGGAIDVEQFSLHAKAVIAPDAANENVGYYPYPQGGNPTNTLTDFYEPLGVALSR